MGTSVWSMASGLMSLIAHPPPAQPLGDTVLSRSLQTGGQHSGTHVDVAGGGDVMRDTVVPVHHAGQPLRVGTIFPSNPAGAVGDASAAVSAAVSAAAAAAPVAAAVSDAAVRIAARAVLAAPFSTAQGGSHSTHVSTGTGKEDPAAAAEEVVGDAVEAQVRPEDVANGEEMDVPAAKPEVQSSG